MSQAGIASVTKAVPTIPTQFTTDSGVAVPAANNLNDLGSGSITTSAVGDTVTTQLTGLTNHNVLVGAGTSTITKIAPSATSGIPFISQGAASDPAFGTAVVAGGGTGVTSNTAYAVLCGGTTSTGAIQSIASVGNSGDVLTSNGAGALPTFQAKSIVTQVFTSNGTYTPTAGMKYCIIECVGGGGGGGGAAAGGANTGAYGGAGGGGGYSRKTVSAATIGSSQTVTIGTAGTAGSAGNNAGGNGGTTSVGAIVSATGGTGGAGSAAAQFKVVPGSLGGTGSSGDINISGGAGTCSYSLFLTGLVQVAYGGNGGSSYFGSGGLGQTATGSVSLTGNAGVGYGGGGCGGVTGSSSSAAAGGAGTAGVVVITEFLI